MTRERLSTTTVGDTSVSPELIAEINETPEITGADVRGAAPVHGDMAAGAFVKKLDVEMRQAQEAMQLFESTASEQDKEALYNPVQHLNRIRELVDGVSANASTNSPSPVSQGVSRRSRSSRSSTGSNNRNQQEVSTSRETGRLSPRNESLGRAALWGMRGLRSLKRTQYKATVKTITAASHLPKTYSKEQAQQKVHLQDEKFARVEQKHTARISRKETQVAQLREQRQAQETAELEEMQGKPRLQRIKERLKNTKVREHMPRFIGGLALAAMVATPLALTAQEIQRNPEGQRVVTASLESPIIESAITQYEGIDFSTRVFVTGGAGQGGNAPIAQMVESGLADGMAVEQITHPGQIGPVVGQLSMEQTVQIGANDNTGRVLEALKDGTVNLTGFSEGTSVNREIAWRIYEELGYWPEGLKITEVGGPNHPGSIFYSKYTEGPVGMILDGMGIDRDTTYPPGANVEYVYFGDDAWAGNGNENFLTFMKNFVELGAGAHDIPDLTDPQFDEKYTLVRMQDGDGRWHNVVVRKVDPVIDAIQRAGIHIMDPEKATMAINAFFPQNYDPNSTEPPRADVRAGMQYAAEALNAQFNTTIFTDIVNALPEDIKQLLDDGWNGINTMADAIMTAANNPTPENIANAFNVVMGQLHTIFGDGQRALDNINGDTKQTIVETVRSQLLQATGMDFGPQLMQLADGIEQFATDLVEKATQQMQEAAVQAQAKAKMSVTDYVASIPKSTTINNAPIVSVNQAATTQSTQAAATTRMTQQSASSTQNYNSPAIVLTPRATVTEAASEPSAQATSAATGQRTSVSTQNSYVAPAESAPIATVSEPAAPAPAPIQEAAPAVSQPVIAEAPAAPARSVAIADAPAAAAPVEVAAPAPAAPAPAEAPALIPAPADAPAAPAPAAVINEAPAPAPAPIHLEKPLGGLISSLLGGGKSSHKSSSDSSPATGGSSVEVPVVGVASGDPDS